MVAAVAYLDHVRQACALVGMQGLVQALCQPGGQHLDLVVVPLLKEKRFALITTI